MFHRTDTATAPPAQDVPMSEPLIPLSHLSLDLPEPELGWPAYLSSRDIAVVEDSAGRSAISSADTRRLIGEHRAELVRQAEHRAAAEKRAVAQDQAFRASLGRGIPFGAVPAGMTYAEAVASAELDSVGYSPRASVIADALDNSGMTFHSLAPDEE